MDGGPVKTRRKRQSGVRSRIIEMLESGPMLAQDILSRGGFSPASLYLNLKALKNTGAVNTERNGRSVSYRLTGTVSSTTDRPAKAGKASKSAGSVRLIEGEVVHSSSNGSSPALVPAVVSRELHESLSALTMRLTPIDRLQEKLLVLDQLARTLPTPVGDVLTAISDDLIRLSNRR